MVGYSTQAPVGLKKLSAEQHFTQLVSVGLVFPKLRTDTKVALHLQTTGN